MKLHRRQPTNFRRWQNLLLLTLSMLLVSTTMAIAAEGGGGDPDKETMFTLILKGGPVMIPLGIASIIALAITLERFISLTRHRLLPPDFLRDLGEAWDKDETGEAAEKFCEDSKGAAGHVFQAGIEWREDGHKAVGGAIEDAGAREADKMKRSLRPLQVIAAICPLLGLLGTVYGMIDAFHETSQSGGAAKTADLANGIYQALVSTAAGLTIAIPVLLVFQWLTARVDALIDYIDDVGTKFISKHARNLRRGRPSTGGGGSLAAAPAAPMDEH